MNNQNSSHGIQTTKQKKNWIINIWQVPLSPYAHWEKQQVFALGREKPTLRLKVFCFWILFYCYSSLLLKISKHHADNYGLHGTVPPRERGFENISICKVTLRANTGYGVCKVTPRANTGYRHVQCVCECQHWIQACTRWPWELTLDTGVCKVTLRVNTGYR